MILRRREVRLVSQSVASLKKATCPQWWVCSLARLLNRQAIHAQITSGYVIAHTSFQRWGVLQTTPWCESKVELRRPFCCATTWQPTNNSLHRGLHLIDCWYSVGQRSKFLISTWTSTARPRRLVIRHSSSCRAIDKWTDPTISMATQRLWGTIAYYDVEDVVIDSFCQGWIARMLYHAFAVKRKHTQTNWQCEMRANGHNGSA